MMYQVLIVDDEEIVCRGLAQFVKWQEQGFEVAGTAHSADEALALLKRLSVNVIFLDIRMPGMSGLELLKILHQRYPAVKCVILSGHSDFSYAQEAIRFGAIDYLTKPVVLKDVEALLQRLFQEFENQRRERQIHTNRLEALLISAAKGYASVDTVKYRLPPLEHWYGLSLGLLDHSLQEDQIAKKKEQMRFQISALIPSARFLNDEVFSLFCIIPCKTAAEFDSFLSMLEQFCTGLQEWACGARKEKCGHQQLHEGWTEAGRALRYHRAGSKEGVILYQNIEPLFSHSSQSMQDALPELLRCLTNPDTRRRALPFLQETLTTAMGSTLTVTQYQSACISFLIELNSYLQSFQLPGTELHRRLNQTLSRILLCQNHPSSADCMMDYLRWLIALLDQSDDQSISRDVIREIQLYIRLNFAENISLNSLAEQFFLHPNYLSRLFKEKTGENFIEYLTEVRMEKVKELLKNSDRKIVEICEMTGYDNPRYFSKVFKQYTGMTPKEYREGN